MTTQPLTVLNRRPVQGRWTAAQYIPMMIQLSTTTVVLLKAALGNLTLIALGTINTISLYLWWPVTVKKVKLDFYKQIRDNPSRISLTVIGI